MKLRNKSKNKLNEVTENLAVNKRDCEIARRDVISHNPKKQSFTLAEKTATTKKCYIHVKRLKETPKCRIENRTEGSTSPTHKQKSVVLEHIQRTEAPVAYETETEETIERSVPDDFAIASVPESSFPILLSASKRDRLSLTRKKTANTKIFRSDDADLRSDKSKDNNELAELSYEPISVNAAAPQTINLRENPACTKRCRVRVKRLTERSLKTKLTTHIGEAENLDKSSASAKPSMKSRIIKRTHRIPVKSNSKKSTGNVSRSSPDIFSADCDPEADIYAFKSQSSQSEREDVAADIIERLKKEGKVIVTKHRKAGARKTQRKPGVHRAHWGKVCKALAAVPPSKKASTKISKTVTFKDVDEISIPHGFDNDDHFDDGIDNAPVDSETVFPAATAQNHQTKQIRNQLVGKVPVNIATSTKYIATSTPAVQKHKSLDRTKLLNFAQKFVNKANLRHSTPNKPRASIPTPNAANMSGASSPWRVDNESMPRTFYFARANDQLPSYSSDVLPSTQQPSSRNIINRSKATSERSFNSSYADSSINLSDIRNISPVKYKDENSLNLSNIENISPPKSTQKKGVREPLIGVNPRKGLADRSPLKAINILNVVTLPNRINPDLVGQTEKPLDKENSNIHNNLRRTPRENSRKISEKSNVLLDNTANKSSDISDLFGFSEDVDEAEGDNVAQSVPKVKLPNKKRLRRKLHDLSRLFPPKPTRLTYRTIKSAFGSPKKQADIRDMVATMKSKPTNESAASTSHIEGGDSTDDERTSVTFTENDCTDLDVHLFDDPEEPQSSFNTSKKMRTYERPKRKPKRVHSFVMFASDSESDGEREAPKTKRSKPNPKQKELKKFVNEFNSMCEEVDKYELVVEKNTSAKTSDGI